MIIFPGFLANAANEPVVHSVYLTWPRYFYPTANEVTFPASPGNLRLSHSNQRGEIDHSITTRHG